MIIDIIMVSASKSKELIKMTQKAIDSCVKSSKKDKFNIILVETTNNQIKYKNAETIYFINKEFNYNKCVNFGLKHCFSTYICFCNNDLIFGKNWASILIKTMKKYKALSGTPFCPLSFIKLDQEANIGYSIRGQVGGWCIMAHENVFKIIGKLDESMDFWYSDNLYINQIKRAGIKHLLAYNSVVKHLENKTLKTLPKSKQIEITSNQRARYNKVTESNKYTFSIIMPSFLGDYLNAAKDRPMKLRRAIKSVLEQTYKDWELIIIADGCSDTVKVYQEFSHHKNIKCLKIPKQNLLAGVVRHKGIEHATGKYIIYLDSDDFYGINHLSIVKKDIGNNDWVYFNDLLYARRRDTNKVEATLKIVKLSYGVVGTSSICHKRSLNVIWNGMDGYGHDWIFVKQLMKYNNFAKISNSEYFICHQPRMIDE